MIEPGDSIFATFSDSLARKRLRLKTDDIVAVSSKVVGISENRILRIDNLRPSREARKLAKRFNLSPFFTQAVVGEADRIVGGVNGALLTVKNSDAVANAGIDRKNAPDNSVVLWPINPDRSALGLRQLIWKKFGKKVGVVIVDSRVTPMRLGTTGLAIGLAGFEPVDDVRGTKDLSDRSIQITRRALADGIAATAQLVMGEAAERKPFVVIRGAPVRMNGNASIRRAKLKWSRCLFMSQIMTNN